MVRLIAQYFTKAFSATVLINFIIDKISHQTCQGGEIGITFVSHWFEPYSTSESEIGWQLSEALILCLDGKYFAS